MIKPQAIFNSEGLPCLIHTLNLVNQHSLYPDNTTTEYILNEFENGLEILSSIENLSIIVSKIKKIVAHFKECNKSTHQLNDIQIEKIQIKSP